MGCSLTSPRLPGSFSPVLQPSFAKSVLQDVVKPHTQKVLTFVSGVYQVCHTFLPPWVRLEIRGNIYISFIGRSSHSAKCSKSGITSAWRIYFTAWHRSGPAPGPRRPLFSFCFALFCIAVDASLFQKSDKDKRSKQGKVFSKRISRRYARHLYCYHLLLPARRALRSRQALNQSVHFSRDLLRPWWSSGLEEIGIFICCPTWGHMSQKPFYMHWPRCVFPYPAKLEEGL